jgi:peroxiredoxin
MAVMKWCSLVLFGYFVSACGTAVAPAALRATLPGTDQKQHELPAKDGDPQYTVLIFRSQECEYVTAHTPRLRELSRDYTARGVRFFGVNPEPDVELAGERASSQKLGFPVLIDRKARLASQVGADYSGYTVVIDGSGEIKYRGGIDSDQTTLHADAEPFLRNALDDLLAGRQVRRPETRALGCMLRTW